MPPNPPQPHPQPPHPLPLPKPLYPPIPHINIRLLTDGPLAPLPAPLPIPRSPTPEPRPKYVPKGVHPPRQPNGDIIHIVRVGKNDAFYRAWDRFTQRKDGGDGERDGSDRGSVKGGPSLERDVEGRPGHVVVENEDGVESRYVLTTLLRVRKAKLWI
jgi:hypothetical protein